MPETPTRYFLSYAHEDQAFADRLQRDITGADCEIFFDDTGIGGGTDWPQRIQTALRECSCLIVVLSRNALASRYVLSEALYAFDHGKRVLPILFEDCEIPFWLWRIQHVDFRRVYDDAFRRLMADLRAEPTATLLDVDSDSSAMATYRPASSRNLVICFDHQLLPTFDLNSNAFELARMARTVSDRQIVYYDPGVEMLGGVGLWATIRHHVHTGLRIWLGRGIAEHVEHAYNFLMDAYRPGDRLYLFGTSAGGLMATVLADALDKFGLLDKAGPVVVPYAVRRLDSVTPRESDDFRSALSRDCHPYFFGMWDCVRVHGAFRRRARSSRLSHHIPFAYHALAIDERRPWFPPLLWEKAEASTQVAEQMWFAGSHADVAGGHAETGLSAIALRWMVDKANACGMLFDAKAVADLAPDPSADLHDSLGRGWLRHIGAARRLSADPQVHPSVRERMRARPDYRPMNLPGAGRP